MLRAERYEAAYLPHRSLRTAALAWLARIPKRVGFRDGWPILYTEVRQLDPTDHEIDRLLALAGPDRTSGAPAPVMPRLCSSTAVHAAAAVLLGANGLCEPLASLAP